MRLRTALTTLAGTGFILLGLAVAVFTPSQAESTLIQVLLVGLALAAFGLALWTVSGRLDATSGFPVPWAEDDPFANPAPERTASEQPLSLDGDALSPVVAEAGRVARRDSLEAGVEIVRAELRPFLLASLEMGGRSTAEAEALLETGDWTTDQLAASVLDPAPEAPERERRQRLREWLHPEYAIRLRTRRAVGAIADCADTDIASIPGHRAPRSVPVLEPRLEDLRVDAEGTLQEAATPEAEIDRPQPVSPGFVVDADSDFDLDSDSGLSSRSEPNFESDADAEPDPESAAKPKPDADPDTDTNNDPPLEYTVRHNRQLARGAVAATIVLAAVGFVDQNPILLLAAVIPLSFATFSTLSRVSVPAGLSLSRAVTPTPVPPGTVVTVTLTVRNRSRRTVADLRIADGVPPDIAVLRGSPRTGITLEPGETHTIQYLIVARRGEHTFSQPSVRIRTLTGAFGSAATVSLPLTPESDDRLECRIDAPAPPISEEGTARVGQLETDTAGEGVSFHSIREYQSDDPASRIDWRHYAKRGTLATINYERSVAAAVVLVIDVRASNRVVAGRGQPTAVELSTYAATRALESLLGTGHEVGVAVVGHAGPGPADLHWLAPGSGPRQRTRALELLRMAAAADSEAESVPLRSQLGQLRELLPQGGQIAVFSPLLEDGAVSAVEWWRASAVPVTVFSPDVIPSNTVRGQFSQLRRQVRLARCQAAGARAFDWRRGTPLPLAIERAFAADVRRAVTRSEVGGRGGGGRREGGAGGGGGSGVGGDGTGTESENEDGNEDENGNENRNRATAGGDD